MLVFDQLKKEDPQLRVVAMVVISGLSLLLVGLWWVQVVSAREYQESLETQSFRTVRIPAVRGKILDINGAVLAENRPTYNISLYLEELHGQFDREYQRESKQARAEAKQEQGTEEKRLGRGLTKKEKRKLGISPQDFIQMRKEARYTVASNVVREISQRLREPLMLDATNFERHYETRLVLPFPVVSDVDPTNIARFEEEPTNLQGVDIEVQSTRVYPYGTLAAHLLGHVKRDDRSVEGEEAFFSYRLPDYRGMVGIEFGFDKELRGAAGAKSVLVNNLGYRQTENVWSPAEPGEDVVLTIDANVQRVAEQALASARVPYTGLVRGA
ncbi:MAG: hypothetical protein ACREP9_03935, partial [Candidatus Dormibacteraceae bacterium]